MGLSIRQCLEGSKRGALFADRAGSVTFQRGELRKLHMKPGDKLLTVGAISALGHEALCDVQTLLSFPARGGQLTLDHELQ